MSDQIPQDAQYIPTGVPAENIGKKSGKTYAILSITSAIFAVFILPIIFGPVGILLGYLAQKKEEKTLGLLGMILSAVCMILGFILGFVAYMMKQKMTGVIIGAFFNF